MFDHFDFTATLEELENLAALYIPKLILAIIVLVVGLVIISRMVKSVRNMLSNRQVDPSLVPFLTGVLNILLVVVLVISVAEMIGVETTSFIAVLGAAGLAIGLALKESLSNFAGGVLILIMKPFKVGDVIEAQGAIASVREIQIFHTILKTFDNKTIILPNGPLFNNKIINYSTEPTRMVEWIFSISYKDNIDKARQIIKDIVYTDDRVVTKAEQYINLSELANSSVNLKVRARVNQADYWGLFFDINEKIKKAFVIEGITIPFPQIDAHLFDEKKHN